MNSLLNRPIDSQINHKIPVPLKALNEIDLLKKEIQNKKIDQLRFLIYTDILGLTHGYFSAELMKATDEHAKRIGLSSAAIVDKIGQKFINNCREYVRQKAENPTQKLYQTQVDLIAEFYKNNADQLFSLEKAPLFAQYLKNYSAKALNSEIPKGSPKQTKRKQDEI